MTAAPKTSANASDTSAKPTLGVGRPMIVLLATFTSIAPLAIDMLVPSAAAIAADLQARPETAAAVMSVFFAGLACGQVLVGPLSDRFGRRGPIIGGLCVFLAASLLAASAQTPETLLAARLLQALGASGVLVTARAVVRDTFDEHGAARFFSLLALVSGCAPILAPALGAAFLTIAGWRSIFLFMALVATAGLVGAIYVLKESRSAATAESARKTNPALTYLTLLRNPRLAGYFLAGACISGCFFTYVANASLIFVNTYGLSPGVLGLLVTINAVGLVGGSQLNRMVLAKRTPSEVLSACAMIALALAALLALFALTQAGGLAVFMTLIFCVVVLTSVLQANAMAGALSVDPTRAGAAAALFGALAFGAGTLFSFTGGLLFDGTPRPAMFIIAGGLIGVAASLKFLALPKREVEQTS
ncbi:MAG: Bcr/CflA family efflux MFS transporter [Hyphomonadaceae bacterium]|nr:Bcr/CflA family efflux MFS transporter [Hyphomonadaceae bacterium]